MRSTFLALVLAGCAPPDGAPTTLPVAHAPTPVPTFARTFASPGLGRAIADRGDADGDGLGDLLVADDAGWRLYLGGPGGLVATPSAQGAASVVSLAFLGDVRRDGTRELAVGGDERTALFSSADGFASPVQSLSTGFTLLPDVPGPLAGMLGVDLDADGDGDLVWAFPTVDRYGRTPGSCIAYLKGSLPGLAVWQNLCESSVSTPGGYVETRFGEALSGPGDVNGDGRPDVVVTAPACATRVGGTTLDAHVEIVDLGGAPGLRVVQSLAGVGPPVDPRCFGDDVALVPDATDDGFDDVLVAGKGGATLLPGSAAGMDAVVASARAGDCPDGDCRVAGTGDMDGDGYGDLAIGSHGGVDVYAGAVWRPAATPMWHVALAAGVAHEVAPLGDVDGDGLQDLAVSVPGTVAVLLGRATDDHDGDGTPDAGDCMRHDGAGVSGPEAPGGEDDEDCDGFVACWVDGDGDRFGDGVVEVPAVERACDAPGLARVPGDCDDAVGSTFPGAPEVTADGVDQDCDGLETCWEDRDHDTWGRTSVKEVPDLSCTTVGVAARAKDCDDARSTTYPGADELVNDGRDEDCDGKELCRVDVDGDRYGDPSPAPVATTVLSCRGAGLADKVPLDCDDTRADVNPGAIEQCDLRDADEDCDGLADDADPSAKGKITWFPDGDADGYGAPPSVLACEPPPGPAAFTGDDCDDARRDVHPGGADLPCDGVDQDCVGGDAVGPGGCVAGDTDTDAGAGDTLVVDTDTDVVGTVDTDTAGPVDSDTDLSADTDTDLPADTELPIGADTDTAGPVDSDTDLPADTDTDLPADTELPIGADTDTGDTADTLVGADTEPPVDTDLAADTEPPVDTEPPADTEPTPDTEPAVDSDPVTDTEPPDTVVAADTEPAADTDLPGETDVATATDLPADTEGPADTELPVVDDTDTAVDTAGGAETDASADSDTDLGDTDAADTEPATDADDTEAPSDSDRPGAGDSDPRSETDLGDSDLPGPDWPTCGGCATGAPAPTLALLLPLALLGARRRRAGPTVP